MRTRPACGKHRGKFMKKATIALFPLMNLLLLLWLLACVAGALFTPVSANIWITLAASVYVALTSFGSISAARTRTILYLLAGIALLATRPAFDGGLFLLVLAPTVVAETTRWHIERWRKDAVARDERARFFEQIIEANPAVIMVKDIHGRYEFMNSRALAVKGRRDSDAQAGATCLVPGERPPGGDNFATSVDSGRPVHQGGWTCSLFPVYQGALGG
jgi:PAS domain-containing protein